jgi:hypothetical protein
LIIIEHDPLLYEDATGMIDLASQGHERYSQRGCSAALLARDRYIPGGSDQKCRLGIPLRRRTESYDEVYFESLSKSAEEPDHPGGMDVIMWRRRRETRPAINPRLQELEAAKAILAEVFDDRPLDVQDMIRRRLEERLWPATFCLGE